MSSSDTSTLTAGVEFPKAWVSMERRKTDDELYILADNRSLGPPSLPLPRGMASTCTMLMVLARLSLSDLLTSRDQDPRMRLPSASRQFPPRQCLVSYTSTI
jgi:hypothetical protein